jgi:hypothetical protein
MSEEMFFKNGGKKLIDNFSLDYFTTYAENKLADITLFHLLVVG